MMMVLVMLTRVTKPLMSLLLMARMMHGGLHMLVHELIWLLLLLLLVVLVIHGGLTMVVTVIVTSAAVIHMT